MLQKIPYIRKSLTLQLILWVGLILLASIFIWAYVNIRVHKQNAIDHIVEEADRLGNTIKLGTHYAMTLNSRDDINQIINNIGRQQQIVNIRIFNKEGQIKFSNVRAEVDSITSIKADACFICHREAPPLETLPVNERTRVFDSPEGHRLLGIISPIYNEPGCSTAPCHTHPADKKVLGALDVVVSLSKTDNEILAHERGIIALAVFTILGISAIICVFFFLLVNRPIKNLIATTQLIGQGNYQRNVELDREDEVGQLALAIHQMGRDIAEKQDQLNNQRDEYQNLFEQVPCHITVQDRDLRIIRYNRETARQFKPQPGDTCYQAYKCRSQPCEICPVLQTFEDGACHTGEEVVINKDGTETHWLVRTTPIRKSPEEITAVMEMSLDITQSKRLEQAVRQSEEKYYNIFNNIPNAVFIVDMELMNILDCNDSVTSIYGFSKTEIVDHSFMKLFDENERESYSRHLKTANVLNQVKQLTKNGQIIFVNIHVSPSEYLGRKALLVVTSDITKRLIIEQQLIQASKMATLGEMSAGVAHELNQPLAVIKTASSFFIRKVKKREAINEEVLKTMAQEIDRHVDRASKIINHLREFGRKAEVMKEPVQVNEAMNRACEMFDQQLKLREIKVVKELHADLPLVLADANRLEQIFINLLVNARDAIEEKLERADHESAEKAIKLRSFAQDGKVVVEIGDSGIGIPEYIRDKIFEPFFTTKKVGQGTGLGLSISYGIVQDYDGAIRVESKENEGSKFTVTFPVMAAAEDYSA
jgi:histidine kinase